MSEFLLELPAALGPGYSGFSRGAALRSSANLDHEEDRVDRVIVVVPANAYTVSSSFFRGLLGASVVKCGSVDVFERKFSFTAAADLLSILHLHAVDAARP